MLTKWKFLFQMCSLQGFFFQGMKAVLQAFSGRGSVPGDGRNSGPGCLPPIPPLEYIAHPRQPSLRAGGGKNGLGLNLPRNTHCWHLCESVL